MAKVACIVVTYNGENYVRKSLSSLKNNVCNTKVIVIDNGSTDKTVEIIKGEFPWVNLIESPKNLGFGKANNIGIKKGIEFNCDYFLFLNQDAWLTDFGLDELLKIYNYENNFSVISPIHLAGNGESLDYYFSGYLDSKGNSRLVYDLLIRRKNLMPVYETSFVNAAIWFLSIQTIKAVGGFDPIFYHYGEDVDYVNRLKSKKLRVGICPGVIGYHDRSQHPRRRENYKSFIKGIYIEELIQLKDINVKYSSAIFKSCKNLLKNMLRNMFLCNKNFIYFFYVYVILLAKLNLIAKHRKISKKKEYCFLKYC
jgi:N-acetylglucosaminyl-diphospho-decaprenol L-rhamnosyltransferase